MRTTEPMLARVKISTKTAFEEAAVKSGMSLPNILNLLGEMIENEDMRFENGKVVIEVPEIRENIGSTPIFDPPELYDDESELYHELHLDKLVKAMRDKGYPDRVIRDSIDGFADKVRDGYKYNSRRDSGEYGC